MNQTLARQLAAQAWCDKTTANTEMDSYLAEAFAGILLREVAKVEDQRDLIRKALVGLVGVDGKEELDGMEAGIRVLPMPEEDRAATLNGVHALKATLSPQSEPNPSNERQTEPTDNPST